MSRLLIATLAVLAISAVSTCAVLAYAFAFTQSDILKAPLLAAFLALWLGLPYVCLLVMAVLLRRNTFERAVLLVLTLFTTLLGLAALLDGLVLHTGILVSSDPNVSHLVTMFLPVHQLMLCLAVVAALLVARWIGSLRRQRQPTSFA